MGSEWSSQSSPGPASSAKGSTAVEDTEPSWEDQRRSKSSDAMKASKREEEVVHVH